MASPTRKFEAVMNKQTRLHQVQVTSAAGNIDMVADNMLRADAILVAQLLQTHAWKAAQPEVILADPDDPDLLDRLTKPAGVEAVQETERDALLVPLQDALGDIRRAVEHGDRDAADIAEDALAKLLATVISRKADR